MTTLYFHYFAEGWVTPSAVTTQTTSQNVLMFTAIPVVVLLVVGAIVAVIIYKLGYLRRPLKSHTKRVVIMRSNQLYGNPGEAMSLRDGDNSSAMLLIPEVSVCG